MFYLNGIESGLRNFECFPPRTCPCQNGPPERESTCVAGLFSGLWCIAVIQEQASPIYLRQHKSARPSTANVVESIAPPISSHISTTYNSCVPGKGELKGEKRANAI